jgi:hypothetical protein
VHLSIPLPNRPRIHQLQPTGSSSPPSPPFLPLPLLQIAAIGESGILGFIEHLNSRAAAQLLAQTLTASSREQMIFRQYEGLFPVPVDFQTAITQSMMWTMLAPFIISCPAGNPVIEFQNFPGLNVVVRFFFVPSPPLLSIHPSLTQNNPDPTPFINTSTPDNNTDPAITHNRSIPLSFPGRQVNLTWELPGQAIGPNSSFVTNTTAGAPQVRFGFASCLLLSIRPSIFDLASN